MALFGLMGNKKPSEAAIIKHVRKVKERYAQNDYRRASMEKLLEWNTKESIDGVIERFSVVVQSPHWDEEEKNWLVEELATKGEVAKVALCNFIGSSNDVGHAISALSKLCNNKETLADLLLDALRKRPPEDYRNSQGKRELIAALGEHSYPRVLEAMIPYLDDHNDDVQCAVMDLMLENKAEISFQRLSQIVTENTHSARVLRHAANAVSKLSIALEPTKKLAPEVEEDYVLVDNKLKLNKSNS